MDEKEIIQAFFRRVGSKGGKTAAKNMTKKERVARAKKANAARIANLQKRKEQK